MFKYLRGAIGLTKAQLGVGLAEPRIHQLRFHRCSTCPQIYEAPMNTPFYARFGPWACRSCGCLVKAKVRLRSERCPLGYW